MYQCMTFQLQRSAALDMFYCGITSLDDIFITDELCFTSSLTFERFSPIFPVVEVYRMDWVMERRGRRVAA